VTTPGLPHYPNYRATFGTSLAVVLSLMASISTAMVVVLAMDTSTQRSLGFLRITPDQVGTITGSAAVVLFVVATLAAVYAQAADHSSMPAAAVDKLFVGRTDKDERIPEWEGRVQTAYKTARTCWTLGVSLLFVTLGALAHQKVDAALPVLAAVALIVPLLNLADADLRNTFVVIVCVVVAAGCGVVGVAAGLALW
jgi:hypothetical protein